MGLVKQCVFRDIEQLKQRIVEAAATVTPDELRDVWREPQLFEYTQLECTGVPTLIHTKMYAHRLYFNVGVIVLFSQVPML